MGASISTVFDASPRVAEPGRATPAVAPSAFAAGELLRSVVGDAPGLRTLVASGGAFQDAFVRDGDVVLLQRDVDVRSGELAAVRLRGDGALRLRRVSIEGDTVRLESETRRQACVTVDRRAVRIVGRVVAIARHSSALQADAQ